MEEPPVARWEHFSHSADMGIRGRGPTPGAAFEQAGTALTAIITDPGLVVPERRIRIACEAPDPELLFADWINELVFLMATKRMLFSRFEVELNGNRLNAFVWGEEVDVTKHRPAVEVKGATFTELRVARDWEGWLAQCVVDV